MKNDVYLEIILHIMQMIILDKTKLDSPEIIEAITFLEEQTVDICELAQIRERGIVICDDFPAGYLLKESDGWRIAIPWPLAETFPDENILAEFCKFANLIKVGTKSSICLSGTSARVSGIPEIGDIDFAEYVFDSSSDLVHGYLRVLRGVTPFCFPVNAKLINNSTDRKIDLDCPWPDSKAVFSHDHNSFIDGISKQRSKVDFIGNSSKFGYIPITNMILPSELSHIKEGISKDSFSFQEAVLTDGEIDNLHLWPLMNPAEMVDYFVFLFNDSKKYLIKRPIKAAKRVSTLLKFLYITDYDIEFATLLASDYAESDAVESRKAEIERMATRLRCSEGGHREFPLDLEKISIHDNKLSDKPVNSGDMSDGCRRLVETAIEDIMSRLKEFDPRLELHFSNGQMG